MKKNKSPLWQWQEKARTGDEVCICGRVAYTVDHIIPISILIALLQQDAAATDEENFQFLCRLCNSMKANRLDHTNPKTIPLLDKYVTIYKELITCPTENITTIK